MQPWFTIHDVQTNRWKPGSNRGSCDPHVHENIDMRAIFCYTVLGHEVVLCSMCNGFSLICLFYFMTELFSSMDGITRQRDSTWMSVRTNFKNCRKQMSF